MLIILCWLNYWAFFSKNMLDSEFGSTLAELLSVSISSQVANWAWMHWLNLTTIYYSDFWNKKRHTWSWTSILTIADLDWIIIPVLLKFIQLHVNDFIERRFDLHFYYCFTCPLCRLHSYISFHVTDFVERSFDLHFFYCFACPLCGLHSNIFGQIGPWK
jgi:hypothetical protein